VRTNPLAAWADERLTLDPTPGTPVPPDYRPAGVKVGVARLEERSNRYEYEAVWLYPNYAAYCQSTNTKALSLRRFTDLLLDLLTVQLHLDTVEQKTTKKGSHVFGIRFREAADDDNASTDPHIYRPATPFLITGQAPHPPAPPWGHGYPSPGEESAASGEEWGEGLNGVGYGSEGLQGDFSRMDREGDGSHHEMGKTATHISALARAYRGEEKKPSFPSLPALARAHPSPDSSPIPHQGAAPVRDGGACPQCRCTHLLVLGTHRKCVLCGWRGKLEHAGESGVVV
jgi:hypothetical protein